MGMVGRQYTANSSYRFGFNGKENDNEVKGEGNQQDYGMRIYDPRIGRFISVDPVGQEYPWNSFFAFAENEVIASIDLDGLERVRVTTPNGVTLYEKDGPYEIPNAVKETYAQSLIDRYKAIPSDAERKGLEMARGLGESMEVGIEAIEQGINWLTRGLGGRIAKPALENAKSSAQNLQKLNPESSAPIPKIPKSPSNPSTTSSNLASGKPIAKGTLNPSVKSAVQLGNRVHYDQINGGTGVGLPTELSTKFPNTQFRYARRGLKGPDVQVVGGTHPSLYPGSSWKSKSNFADFKPGTPSGIRTFLRDVRTGKLPGNTQLLKYNANTGKLE